MVKHSATEHGNQHDVLGIAVRKESGTERMSPCEVRVGKPVEGPTR